MDQEDKITNENQSYHEGMVHLVLSQSYTVFLLAVVLGVIFDIIFPIDIFGGHLYKYIGLIMIMVGSLLIYWAQSTSNRTKKTVIEKDGNTFRTFAHGPYKYSRNPTHIGLSIMVLGLAFIINSLFSVIFTVIASLITKLIFVKREEALLEKKYGQVYSDYKKKVRTWV